MIHPFIPTSHLVSMTQLKCSQIREKKPDELEKDLNNLHEELNTLKITNKKSDQIENVQKSIVNIHIVQNQTTKENLRKFYQGEKYKPKDLRPKKTRAMRRLLTPEEQSIQLAKTQRKKAAFPKRTFAIKE